MEIQWIRETEEDAHLIQASQLGPSDGIFLSPPYIWFTAHLRSCTGRSATNSFDASESKGYMAALSTELSA